MSDEELQNRLEAGEKISGKDALAYRKIFDALEREPDFRLPINFADSVMNRINSKRESRKEHFILAGGIFFFIAATCQKQSRTNYQGQNKVFFHII